MSDILLIRSNPAIELSSSLPTKGETYLAPAFAARIACASSNIKVGCTLNMAPCIPSSTNKEDLEATKVFDTYWNRSFADPMYLGKYPEKLFQELNNYIRTDDMKTI